MLKQNDSMWGDITGRPPEEHIGRKYHWVINSTGDLVCWEWQEQSFWINGLTPILPERFLELKCRYAGPCYEPHEVWVNKEGAATAMKESAALLLEGEARQFIEKNDDITDEKATLLNDMARSIRRLSVSTCHVILTHEMSHGVSKKAIKFVGLAVKKVLTRSVAIITDNLPPGQEVSEAVSAYKDMSEVLVGAIQDLPTDPLMIEAILASGRLEDK